MRIQINGELAPGVTAKDVALGIIARYGTAAANGCAVEFAGSTVRAMSMEERMTLCNLSVELGARTSLIAPDATTTTWLAGRPYAPTGDLWNNALSAWEELHTDEGAEFHVDLSFDASDLSPMVTWGTSPEHGIAISGVVPDPQTAPSDATRDAWTAALEYMDLKPGQTMAGTPIDWVFIGSCANSRLSDLRDAARVVEGRTVAPHVTAWVVPGSEQVRRQAEAEGLHTIFEASRVRVAAARLQHVRCGQRRTRSTICALCIDLEPQLRRPTGSARPNPPGQPRHRRSIGNRRRA